MALRSTARKWQALADSTPRSGPLLRTVLQNPTPPAVPRITRIVDDPLDDEHSDRNRQRADGLEYHEPTTADLQRDYVVRKEFLAKDEFVEVSFARKMFARVKMLEEQDNARRQKFMKEYETAKTSGLLKIGKEKYLVPLLQDGRSMRAIAGRLEELGADHFVKAMEYLRVYQHYEYLPVRILRAAITVNTIPTIHLEIQLSRIVNSFIKQYGVPKYERAARSVMKAMQDLARIRGSKVLLEDHKRRYQLMVNLPEPLVVDTLHLLNDNNLRLGDYSLLRMVSRLCKTEKYLYLAYKMLMNRDSYVTDHLTLIVETYASVLTGLLKKDYWEEGLALIQTLKKHGLPPGRATYNTLLYHSAKNGDIEKFSSIYKSFLEAGLTPCMITLTSLYTLEQRRGNVDGEAAVINAMKEREGRVSPFVISTKIMDWDRLEKALRPPWNTFADLVLEHFKPGYLVPLGIVPPSPAAEDDPSKSPLMWIDYKVIMRAFFGGVQHDAKVIREVLKRYLQNRSEWEMQPDWWLSELGVLTALVDALGRDRDNLPLAVNLTQYYTSRQYTYAGRLTSSKMWQTLVKHHAWHHEVDLAESFLQTTIEIGGVPDSATWGQLFVAYSEEKRWHDAGRTFARMLLSNHSEPTARMVREFGSIPLKEVLVGFLDYEKSLNGVYPEDQAFDIKAAFQQYAEFMARYEEGDEDKLGQEKEEEDQLGLEGLYEAYATQNAKQGRMLDAEGIAAQVKEGEEAVAQMESTLEADVGVSAWMKQEAARQSGQTAVSSRESRRNATGKLRDWE